MTLGGAAKSLDKNRRVPYFIHLVSTITVRLVARDFKISPAALRAEKILTIYLDRPFLGSGQFTAREQRKPDRLKDNPQAQ
jgi:hypothetical protein